MSKHLTSSNDLLNQLWIDDSAAPRKLEAKARTGEIDEAERAVLSEFIDKGYAFLKPGGLDQHIDALVTGVDDLWRDPPFDLAGAGPLNGGRPMPLVELAVQQRRAPGVRILDLHSHLAAARELYLNERVHRMCSLILGGQAVATQSLFFEYGSTQSLHRDPWYVNHTPRTHLVAAWFALEDAHPDSGPLSYVAGSHRLPWYRFSTDDVVFHDALVTDDERRKATDHMNALIAERKMTVEKALPRRGEVFLWHGSLVHGGSPVVDPTRTRRSLVVHFGRADTHPRRGVALARNGVTRLFYTDKKYVASSGTLGFHNPMVGAKPSDWEQPAGATTPQAHASPAGEQAKLVADEYARIDHESRKLVTRSLQDAKLAALLTFLLLLTPIMARFIPTSPTHSSAETTYFGSLALFAALTVVGFGELIRRSQIHFSLTQMAACSNVLRKLNPTCSEAFSMPTQWREWRARSRLATLALTLVVVAPAVAIPPAVLGYGSELGKRYLATAAATVLLYATVAVTLARARKRRATTKS
jgi:phytanoyl-CoA hydroxylase